MTPVTLEQIDRHVVFIIGALLTFVGLTGWKFQSLSNKLDRLLRNKEEPKP